MENPAPYRDCEPSKTRIDAVFLRERMRTAGVEHYVNSVLRKCFYAAGAGFDCCRVQPLVFKWMLPQRGEVDSNCPRFPAPVQKALEDRGIKVEPQLDGGAILSWGDTGFDG